MKEITNLNVIDLNESVNKIFECKEKTSTMALKNAEINAENILLDHLAKAFKMLGI